MKIISVLLVLVAVVYAPPAVEKGRCRPPIPKLRMIFGDDNIIDLTHEYNEDTVYWPTNPFGFEMSTIYKGYVEVSKAVRYFLNYNTYRQPEHFGTHMDAPGHFSENGIPVSQVALKGNLIGQGYLINLKHNNESIPDDHLISIRDIKQWERENGKIRSESIVLLYTGYGDFFHDHAAYLGTNLTGPGAVPHIRFPGLDPKAAKFLITQRCIGAVGIDTMSIDAAHITDFGSHRYLTAAGVSILENVGNLYELDKRGKSFKVVALPQKLTNGTGAATRIIAVLD